METPGIRVQVIPVVTVEDHDDNEPWVKPVGHLASKKQPLLDGPVIVHPEVPDVEARTQALLDDVSELTTSGHTPPQMKESPRKAITGP